MRVELVYLNAGGGHRATAVALQAVLAEQRPRWDVEAVNLFELLDPQQRFRRLFGFAPEEAYNLCLRRGWTWGMEHELKLLQQLIRWRGPKIAQRLAAHWARSRPDLVVSLIPNFNRWQHAAVKAALPGTPFVTLLTDMADLSGGFWIEPFEGQHVVCGTERALAQARAAGHPASHMHATSGMVLHPRFHRPVAEDRCAKKTALGFDPALPAGLVSFGAYGAQEMRVIAERLADRQALFICGHNQRLARAIAAVPATAPRRILGFTTELPELMDACDYFIGKPGPGSIGEALARGLPVIVSRNARTMPQERYNADWVLEQGVGQVVRHFREVDQTVTQLLARLPIYRRRLRRLDNHAVFQLPGILDTVLQAGSLRSTAPLHPTEPALA